MTDVVVLDSGPVGLLTHPRNPPLAAACRAWLVSLLAAGRRVVLPEITDYETRRAILRRGSQVALTNLDLLIQKIEYLPLNTPMMRHAAALWAHVRSVGLPTASPDALDGDVILAAQALSLGAPVVVATDNVGHLSRFVPAASWRAVAP